MKFDFASRAIIEAWRVKESTAFILINYKNAEMINEDISKFI